MKTITLKVIVPEWARWVATDKDGTRWIFKRKPKLLSCTWWPKSFWPTESKSLDVVKKPKDFTKTLRRIK